MSATHSLIPTVGEPPMVLLLRPADAARALGISIRTLWDISERGEIPRVKIGRAVGYSVDSLRAYIAQKEREGIDAR